ncbi:unnamed protein product [Ascophyllum nodosum]
MDLQDLAIKPGKIHLVREILHDGVTGSVKVLGSLTSYDAAANLAVIEYKGDKLSVDSSLLPGFQFRIDSLYEFIGEIQASGALAYPPPFLELWERRLLSCGRNGTINNIQRLIYGIS